mmetsp:Transcript_2995/g.10495  ORF Transcript_2995/g.10495 Transcript_2995/m.10495 type:complete len:359 (+) Transcript_2995:48-1124(+)
MSSFSFGEEFGGELDDLCNFDVDQWCREFTESKRQSVGRRPLGPVDRNSLPARESLGRVKQEKGDLTAWHAPTHVIFPENELNYVDGQGAVGRGCLPGFDNTSSEQRRESLICHEQSLDEPETQETAPVHDDTLPLVLGDGLNNALHEVQNSILSMTGCEEKDLQFLYADVPPTMVTTTWYGSKGNCRGWEMLRFQEEARIGRRKLLVIDSSAPVTLTVLLMMDGIPLHDLRTSELHLERLAPDAASHDGMGSGIPADKDLANCSLALEVEVGPGLPEARVLLHCERLGKERRRNKYTVIVLDKDTGSVVCSWNCHVYNLKYESMNRRNQFVPTANGASPSHYQLCGTTWAPVDVCGP